MSPQASSKRMKHAAIRADLVLRFPADPDCPIAVPIAVSAALFFPSGSDVPPRGRV